MDDTAELTNPGALTQILAAGGNPDPSPSFASASENAPPTPAPDVSGNATTGMPATSSLGGQMPPPREPGTSELGKQPYHKAEFFRSMLGDFLYSAGKGLAARGGGPEADSRGAGAAITAIPERNIMQQQIGIQRTTAESEAALRKAQANKAEQEAQSVPVTLANGQQVYMPASIAKQILAAQTTGQSRENAAKTAATSREVVADTGATSRENVANIGATAREKVASISAANKPPTEMSLLMSAQKGDKDAAAALDKLQQNRLAIAKTRGPAGRYMNFYDPDTKQTLVTTASNAEELQKQGRNLVNTGAVPASQIVQMQHAQSSIPAFIKEIRANIKAWDNAGDRAIFAKVLKENPMGGDPSSWLGTLLNSEAMSKLSPEGKAAIQAVRGLNDAMGSLRVISGLPSTVGSMMTTAALVPGATSPDSKFATSQLDQIGKLLERETGIPLFGGNKNAGGGGTSKTLDQATAQKYLQQAGGDKNKARVLAKKDGFNF